MATNGMEIKVGADVGDAVKGIARLQQSFQNFGGIKQNLATTGKNFDLFLGKVAKSPQVVNQSTQSLVNFGRVVQDAPFGIIGIANNIDPLLNSFQQLKASTGSSTLAFKALGSALIGPAGIAVAVSAITSLLVVYTQKKQQEAAALKNSKDALQTFADIQKEVATMTVATYNSITLYNPLNQSLPA